MKTVLFINSGFNLGGIETFLLRAANQLKHEVKYKLLLMSDSYDNELLDRFKQYGEVYFLKDIISIFDPKYATLRTIAYLRKNKVENLLANVDVIHASCSFSLPLMNMITSLSKRKITRCVGVYHSREFQWGESNKLMRQFQISSFMDIPSPNVIFMNEYTCNLYCNIFKKDFYKTLPIGIDTELYSNCVPGWKSKRIVSIGRLVDFKTYNYHMIDVLSKRLDRDNFIFEIYGNGPEKQKLEDYAKSKKVAVKFFGSVDYSLLPTILNNSFLFVGCGTAIVEAAAAGVPSIIGVESERDGFTPGFLTNTNGLSFQEKGLNKSIIHFSELFDKLVNLSEDEYNKLSNQHRTRSELFSLKNMKESLINYYNDLEYVSVSNKMSFQYRISLISWVAANKLGFNHERASMYDF